MRTKLLIMLFALPLQCSLVTPQNRPTTATSLNGLGNSIFIIHVTVIRVCGNAGSAAHWQTRLFRVSPSTRRVSRIQGV